MVVSAHDAEELLRPVLGRLHEAEEAFRDTPSKATDDELDRALVDALDQALALLGVQR